MKQILSIITTVFDICWLCTVLLFLWFIWRSSTRHMRKLIQALSDAALVSARAAQQAAEAAYRLAEEIQKQHREGKQPPP